MKRQMKTLMRAITCSSCRRDDCAFVGEPLSPACERYEHETWPTPVEVHLGQLQGKEGGLHVNNAKSD